MSRYVRTEVHATRAEIESALSRLGISVQSKGTQKIMLEGSLECAGEPVDLRLLPGVGGAVEDFGFINESGGLVLVCGDVDRKTLEREFMAPLLAEIAEARIRASAAAEGLRVHTTVEADGTRRLSLHAGDGEDTP